MQHERDYYRIHCDDLGSKVLRLQRELTSLQTSLKRSRTATSMILKTYRLIHDDVSIEDMSKRFLQVFLSIMWADRAMILQSRDGSHILEPHHYLGLDHPGVPELVIEPDFPDYMFFNSRSEPSSRTARISECIDSPYFIWMYNRKAGVALLIGNSTEDRNFRLPFMNGDREVVESALGVYVDIAGRKRTERSLIKSEGRYRRLVQSSPESILVSSDGILTLANQAGLRLLGADSADQVIGRSLLEFVCPDDLSAFQMMIEGVLESGKEVPLSEKRLRRLDGNCVDVELVVIPFASQERPAVQIVALDISERRKMEKELIRVEKIESLGVLAGGIAHDFNNILTGILGNIDLARIHINPDHSAYSYLEDADTASRIARDLTQKLLTFAKGGFPLRRILNLSEITSDSVGFILSGSKVKFDYNETADLRAADIDAVQFRQVIENLAINAQQAMPDGGVFSITAENALEADIIALQLPGKLYIKLKVCDQGHGIPRENLPKIFDPYFTTKDNGSGLGLATTFSIIKKHGGHISVDSERGLGTTFSIYIPASEEEPIEIDDKPDEMTCGKGYILFMDDEKMVRKIATNMLSKLGFRVAVACDGQEALDMYRSALSSSDRFDAVIMDLTIPGGMGGQELVTKLLELNPDAKAIVASGYSNDPVLAGFENFGFSGRIAKPFSLTELSACLQHVLGPL